MATPHLIHQLHSRIHKTRTASQYERFGRQVAEYIQESQHQEWDGHGHDFRQRRAVLRMLADMELCMQMMDRDDFERAEEAMGGFNGYEHEILNDDSASDQYHRAQMEDMTDA